MVHTSKILGSIEREVRALSTAIDTLTARLLLSHPDVGLTVRRTPDRVVLQAGNVGVTVSMFRSRAGAAASAEVVLAVWEGQLTLPGSSPREGKLHATCVRTQEFQIVAQDDASWLWADQAGTDPMTSPALATACIDTMAGELQRC